MQTNNYVCLKANLPARAKVAMLMAMMTTKMKALCMVVLRYDKIKRT